MHDERKQKPLAHAAVWCKVLKQMTDVHYFP